MKLKKLRDILNADTVKVYLNTKNDYFINNNGVYETLNEDSLNMWLIYGEYEVEELYVEDEILIIVVK